MGQCIKCTIKMCSCKLSEGLCPKCYQVTKEEFERKEKEKQILQQIYTLNNVTTSTGKSN